MAVWNALFGGGRTDDSIETIQQNLADGRAVMLDVRGQAERDAGFLKDSIFIPITEIKQLAPDCESVNGLPKDQIVYCH